MAIILEYQVFNRTALAMMIANGKLRCFRNHQILSKNSIPCYKTDAEGGCVSSADYPSLLYYSNQYNPSPHNTLRWGRSAFFSESVVSVQRTTLQVHALNGEP